jgi:hypothetical protein
MCKYGLACNVTTKAPNQMKIIHKLQRRKWKDDGRHDAISYNIRKAG